MKHLSLVHCAVLCSGLTVEEVRLDMLPNAHGVFDLDYPTLHELSTELPGHELSLHFQWDQESFQATILDIDMSLDPKSLIAIQNVEGFLDLPAMQLLAAEFDKVTGYLQVYSNDTEYCIPKMVFPDRKKVEDCNLDDDDMYDCYHVLHWMGPKLEEDVVHAHYLYLPNGPCAYQLDGIGRDIYLNEAMENPPSFRLPVYQSVKIQTPVLQFVHPFTPFLPIFHPQGTLQYSFGAWYDLNDKAISLPTNSRIRVYDPVNRLEAFLDAKELWHEFDIEATGSNCFAYAFDATQGPIRSEGGEIFLFIDANEIAELQLFGDDCKFQLVAYRRDYCGISGTVDLPLTIPLQ